MDCFIKKIFERKTDEVVHAQFQKFSRGEFRGKALVKAKKSGGKFFISTTYEYSNEFVRMVAEKIKDEEKTKVTGAIISTRNLKELPEFNKIIANAEVKQFMGIKQFKIDLEMSREQILDICNIFHSSFLALSFSAGNTQLKIKAKSPKSSKPSTKTQGIPNPDFCKLQTDDELLAKNILFDVPDFKKLVISHDFIISELDIPKNESDPAKMREKTIRKGRIIRKLNIDGKSIVREVNFEA